MTDALEFTGKMILITGGATGIGRATALAFAQHGGTVVIGDIDARAEESVQLIQEAGGTALLVSTDVTVADQVDTLVRQTVDTYGGLHVAFNNAGVLPPTGPLLEQTEAAWDKIIEVDLKGVFLSLKAEIAHMVTRGGGSIINTASVAGVIADPGMSPYVAAKHGVIGLTKAHRTPAANARIIGLDGKVVAMPATCAAAKRCGRAPSCFERVRQVMAFAGPCPQAAGGQAISPGVCRLLGQTATTVQHVVRIIHARRAISGRQNYRPLSVNI